MSFRLKGLTIDELELLRHCREFFALPATATRSKPSIVGILLIEGEKPIELLSGWHGGPCGGTQRGNIPRGPRTGNSLITLTHIEGHAAAVMYERKVSRARLLIEYEPCKACDPALPSMLPSGARLELVSPVETTYYWSCHGAR
jgi:SCP1.201-like deaminase